MKPLRFSFGSAVGADHVKSKKNCQDAVKMLEKDGRTIAFVADGCGDAVDSPFSEVGSRIGVNLVTNYITSRLDNLPRWSWKHQLESDTFWKEVQDHTLDQIESTALGMGGSFSKNVINHFLFTLVGFVMIPEITVIAGNGDGYYFVNGKETSMMVPNPENMPVYLAYNLVETSLKKMSPEDLRLNAREALSTHSISSIAVVTDGINPLLTNPEKLVPGTKIPVGGPDQFWNTEGYFENPHTLGSRLNQLTTEKRLINWSEQRMDIHPAVITDDLAIVVGSRI